MKKVRGIHALMALAAAGALLTACSSSDAPVASEPSVKGSPIGRPIAAPAATAQPAISPSPPAGAPLIANLKYDLRKRTVAMAGAPGRTSAVCDKTSLAAVEGATVTCTVAYEGVNVVWPVTIGGPAWDGTQVIYRAVPSTGILTREGAEASFWSESRAFGTDLRCDDMPAVKRVPLDRATGYRCTYRTRSETDEAVLWVPFDVKVRASGPHFVGRYAY